MSSFCTAKATHIFSAKNFSIFAYHLIKILTWLVLNNWALLNMTLTVLTRLQNCKSIKNKFCYLQSPVGRMFCAMMSVYHLRKNAVSSDRHWLILRALIAMEADNIFIYLFIYFFVLYFSEKIRLFIPRYTIVAGYYGFTLVAPLSVHPSICRTAVCPSIFSFLDNFEWMLMDFHQTWYVHWYYGDLVCNC